MLIFITPLCTFHCLNIHLYAVMQATHVILITSHADTTHNCSTLIGNIQILTVSVMDCRRTTNVFLFHHRYCRCGSWPPICPAQCSPLPKPFVTGRRFSRVIISHQYPLTTCTNHCALSFATWGGVLKYITSHSKRPGHPYQTDCKVTTTVSNDH